MIQKSFISFKRLNGGKWLMSSVLFATATLLFLMDTATTTTTTSSSTSSPLPTTMWSRKIGMPHYSFVSASSSATNTIGSSPSHYNKTVCILPIETDDGWIEVGAHAYHTVNFYKQRFLPQINFSPKYLMGNSPTVKNFVTTWVTSGRQECDLVIGSGFSFLALAMSPLVDIPWVGTTETSVELSDKENHPAFSRVIPTDEVGAQAADILYQEYGWNTSNIFCSDESYGRSVAAGFFDVLISRGGEVDINRCLETTATEDRV